MVGFPLSGELACHSLEFVENRPSENISLLIYPHKTTLFDYETLNEIEYTFEFSCERETNKQLTFLDIMLNRTDNDLKLNIYRKSTDKDVFMNF